MKSISRNIRKKRLAFGWTQTELASKLGVQYQTVSKWETGTTFPDITILPAIADVLDISLDELFGRQVGCHRKNVQESNFLLRTYAQMYEPEAGPWNLSAENKYLEYRFADFFEEHFAIGQGSRICNIGIGAGMWDTYLAYKLNGGSLTSIDKLEICCKQLQERLIYEGNPNSVYVICGDVMDLTLEERFDIVTMVGTTVMEGEVGLKLLERGFCLLNDTGSMYYQSLDAKEDINSVLQTAYRHGMKLIAFIDEMKYGITGRYYKFQKEK